MNFLSLSFFFGFLGVKLEQLFKPCSRCPLYFFETSSVSAFKKDAASIGAKRKLQASFRRNFLKAII